MKHTHLNATGTFPIFAAIVVIAGQTHRLDVVGPLAPWGLYARIAQTVVHLSGTSMLHRPLRASAFLVQVFLMGWMILRLVGA
jgi:hypothetical protein